MKQINTLMPFSGYIDSRQGGRKENQDFCGFSDTLSGLLITVCDGMGGGPGGKTASVIAVETIIREIQHADPRESSREEVLKSAIKTANKLICQKGHEIQALKGMGSTVTVLLINQESAIVAHVGDSRVYQFRRKQKKFRTFDHSMVFELVKQKVLTEEQARLSEESNLITRALGIKPDVDVEIHELSYEKGDRFMLCTDGISGALPEKELVKVVSSPESAGRALDDIIVLVDEQGFHTGGTHDNLTAAIIESNINSKLKEKMNTRTRNRVIGLAVLCCMSLAGNLVLLNRSASPAEQSQDVAKPDSVLSAQNQQIQELKKDMDTMKESLKEAQGLLKNKDFDGAQKLLDDENTKQSVLDKLDKIIEQLDSLGKMQKGKEKNDHVDQVKEQLHILANPLIEKYGVKSDLINDKDKGLLGFLSQSIAKEEGDKCKGHYNAIVKQLHEIRKKINNSK